MSEPHPPAQCGWRMGVQLSCALVLWHKVGSVCVWGVHQRTAGTTSLNTHVFPPYVSLWVRSDSFQCLICLDLANSLVLKTRKQASRRKGEFRNKIRENQTVRMPFSRVSDWACYVCPGSWSSSARGKGKCSLASTWRFCKDWPVAFSERLSNQVKQYCCSPNSYKEDSWWFLLTSFSLLIVYVNWWFIKMFWWCVIFCCCFIFSMVGASLAFKGE